MAAFPTPFDQTDTGSRRVPQRHRRAGLGIHPSAVLPMAVSPKIGNGEMRTALAPLKLPFEDRETPGNWRVEKMDEDGGYDVVKVFTGPDAREQAIRYAEREFGSYDEIRLPPYPRP
jgi:hypothetical protein